MAICILYKTNCTLYVSTWVPPCKGSRTSGWMHMGTPVSGTVPMIMNGWGPPQWMEAYAYGCTVPRVHCQDAFPCPPRIGVILLRRSIFPTSWCGSPHTSAWSFIFLPSWYVRNGRVPSPLPPAASQSALPKAVARDLGDARKP